MSDFGWLHERGNLVKRVVVALAAAAALLVPASAAGAAESCRVCVRKCGHGYVVYWYDLQGRYDEILNACIIQ